MAPNKTPIINTCKSNKTFNRNLLVQLFKNPQAKSSQTKNAIKAKMENNSLIKEPEEIVQAKNVHNSLITKTSNPIQLQAKEQLKSSHFRFINEKLYTCTGAEAMKLFQKENDTFLIYHAGYQQQISKWPVSPVDIIIQDIHKMQKSLVIADFGCGDAKIAQTFPDRTVYSFDIKALNQYVIECDISKVPLANGSVDIAVFCLSLMGTNFADFLIEACRVLRKSGILKIAEVQSRIENMNTFMSGIKDLGYNLVGEDSSQKMFHLFTFKKNGRRINKKTISEISLKPCLYKKR